MNEKRHACDDKPGLDRILFFSDAVMAIDTFFYFSNGVLRPLTAPPNGIYSFSDSGTERVRSAANEER
jgi:hypothetical protein